MRVTDEMVKRADEQQHLLLRFTKQPPLSVSQLRYVLAAALQGVSEPTELRAADTLALLREEISEAERTLERLCGEIERESDY